MPPASTTRLPVQVPGATLQLLPDRALYWPDRQTLFIADVHFGKAAAFRAHSIAVPGGTTANDLARISRLVEETEAKSVYILGDMWHARQGLVPETVQAVADWRNDHPNLEVVLVKGNHDRKCGELPPSLNIESVEEPHLLGPFWLVHEPMKVPSEFEDPAPNSERQTPGPAYALCGHIHPCVRLEGAAQTSHRLPCFWFTERVAVLPAFGSFTGCARIQPAQGDRVFVIADNQIVEC